MAGRAGILIVGLNYAPEQVGIGPFTRGMAEGLAARGHLVRVIAGKPYYPQWRAAALPSSSEEGIKGWWRSASCVREASLRRDRHQPQPPPLKRRGQGGMLPVWHTAMEGGVGIVRCPHYVPAQPTGLRRIVHLASFALAVLLPALLALRGRPRVVICVAPALLSVPVAWLAARLSGAKLWVHVQDFEVEAALATGLVNGGLAGRLARRLENGLLRLADRVSSISPQMCARLIAKGVPAAQVSELRNWANAPAPDPAAGAAYRAEWGLGDRRVALYSGNIANKQGIGIVIEAARLLAHRADLCFVICGEGPNRARLKEQARGLANVQFHDLQPAERMGELLSLASVHLLPQIAGAADLVLPSKLANMLASGRPVVATAEPGTGLHAEVTGCGLTTPPGDAGALAVAIERLLDDPALAEKLGREGQRRAAERWAQDAIVARLGAEIDALAEAR